MVTIRRFTPADLPLAQTLVAGETWNLTEADLRRLVNLDPEGGFVALEGDEQAGVAFGLTYATTGWVHSVIVDSRWRGRGIGGRLTAAVVDHLRARGIATIKLDATSMGLPVYTRLGFRKEFQVNTFSGEPRLTSSVPKGIGALTPEHAPEVLELDRLSFGDDRGRLLRALLEEFPDLAAVRRGRGGKITGYALARPVVGGHFLGPIVADPGDLRGVVGMATMLLRRARAKRVHIYIPSLVPGAERLPAALGLDAHATTVRMTLGPPVAEVGIWGEGSHAKG